MAKVEIEDSELSTLREGANRATALETSLKNAETALKSAREAAAKAIITGLFAGRKMDDKAKESFTALAMRNIPVTAEGTLDEATFRDSVEGIINALPAVTTEVAAGAPGGAGTGGGSVNLGNGGASGTGTNVREDRIKLYMRSGFSKEVAEKMAGR